jgi:ABC-type sugar transport system ATPase subunit
LLVEQVVEPALAVADDVVVLDSGRVVASGPVSEFQDRALVEQIYLRGAGAATSSAESTVAAETLTHITKQQ